MTVTLITLQCDWTGRLGILPFVYHACHLVCTGLELEYHYSHLYFSPICSKSVPEKDINKHIDSNCQSFQSQQPSSSRVAPPFHPLFTVFRKPVSDSDPLQSTNTTADLVSKKRARPPDTIARSTVQAKKQKSSAQSSVLPLSERLRPRSLEEFIGQSYLTTPGSPLLNLLDSGSACSFIFWGPPGCVHNA